MNAAGERINEARRHIRSARVLAGDDPTLAIAACHDAVRKAITAHMVASGLRPRSGDGAHPLVLGYAKIVLTGIITPSDLREADDLRRDRALAEYGDFAPGRFGSPQVEVAAALAERIVNAVADELAGRSRRRGATPLANRSALQSFASVTRSSQVDAIPAPPSAPAAAPRARPSPRQPPSIEPP
jgi:hypothetical protein